MINQGFIWFPAMVQVHDRDTHVGVTAHLAVCRRDLPQLCSATSTHSLLLPTSSFPLGSGM